MIVKKRDSHVTECVKQTTENYYLDICFFEKLLISNIGLVVFHHTAL